MYNLGMSLAWVFISLIAGVWAARFFALSTNVWLGAGLFLVVFLILLRRPFVSNIRALLPLSNAHFLFFLSPVAFMLGGVWYQFRQPQINAFHIAFYNDRNYEILVTGTLAEPPDLRDTYTNLRIKVEAVDSGSGTMPVKGMMLARTSTLTDYEYGQQVRLRGHLKTPPENEEFSYRDYLAQQGIYASMSAAKVTVLPGNGGSLFFRWVYQLKASLLKNTYRLYPDPEASLLAGILFGVDTGLPARLQNAFKNTGTAHIIAISGFNIAIIAGILFSLFKRILGEKNGAAFAILGIFFYTLLVGADAAVVRAAWMGSLSLLARQLGRRNDGMNALAAVALGMVIWNPLVLWDVGFQLSFFATLGLILYAEPFSNFTHRLISKLSKQDVSMFTQIINDNIVLTFAAQLTTIPIMAYHFQRISLISLIANPFILPVQPLVMILGGLAVFISLILFPLGQALAWVALPFSSYTIHTVELFDRVPQASIFIQEVSAWQTAAVYLVIFGVTFGAGAIKQGFSALKNFLRPLLLSGALILVFACAMLIWRQSAAAGDGQLHVIFLEAGSADAVLIRTPEGKNLLINGGESAANLSDELGRRLPVFRRELDWLIVASTQENQLRSLPRVVERYPPQSVLWSGNMQASFSAQRLDQYFAEHQIPVSPAEVGQRLPLGNQAWVEVQAVSPRGMVLLIEYKNFRALLPIGINSEMLDALKEDNLNKKVDVLLLADAGYAPSNPPELIESLNPELAVLSVAAGDPNGLPAPEVIQILGGYSLLRTDRNGWIAIHTDGDTLRVEVERGQ